LEQTLETVIARRKLDAIIDFVARMPPKKYDAQFKADIARLDSIERSITDE